MGTAVNQPESASRAARRPRAYRRTRAAECAAVPRVTVAWTASSRDGAPNIPTEVELVAELESAASGMWTCADSFGGNWVEAISSAHCSEVLLTARLGDDIPAKHLVLELAQLLTFKLSEGHPLIRVRFLPNTGERSVRSRA